MSDSPERLPRADAIARFNEHAFANLPSGNPLDQLPLVERAVFLLRAYHFRWTEIAAVLRRDRSGLYRVYRRAYRHLERTYGRVAPGVSAGLPPDVLRLGVHTAGQRAEDDEA